MSYPSQEKPPEDHGLDVEEDSDDDIPTLSAETLRALQEFRSEQQQRLTPNDTETTTIQEDWQLSQFWYDDVTADVLAREALRVAGTSGGRIACVSCPTVYRRLKAIGSSDVTLFEYDLRFQTFGDDFVFYDYRQPVSETVTRYRAVFDVVLVDPPFLSDECLTKTAMTVRMIAKEKDHKVILCTGATMEDLAFRMLGLRICAFRPGHARNLANEFRCYANYDLDSHVSS